MNLWGKRAGLFFLSALFVFSSCKDDLNKIGTQADQDKFQVFYKEFVVPSTTVLFDSVRTDNTPTFLIGGYSDDLFGEVSTTPYMSFFPLHSSATLDLKTKQKIVDNVTSVQNVILDSIMFQTKLDRYHYGLNSGFDETINFTIHELLDSIKSANYQFNTTEYAFDPNPLTSLELVYNTETIDTLSTDGESILLLDAKLPESYLKKMKDAIDAVTLKDGDGYDSTLVHSLTDYLNGFVLKTQNEPKDVLGLSLAQTGMALHYHVDGEGTAQVLSFSFIASKNFNHISSDRLSTPVEVINEFDKAYDLEGERFIQAGTGIRTSLDFDEALIFLSENENLIVNSTELVFENITSDEKKQPPFSINFYNASESFDRNSIVVGGEDINTLYTDGGETYSLLFDVENNLYQGIPRRYFQDMYDNGITTSRLVVNPISNGYSLNRFTVNGDNIKLKLYYSIPNN